jgi:hypothetical protein
MTEQLAHTWRKASYSGGSGACVEIAVLSDDTIAIRDSKNPTTNLTVAPAAWTTFLANTKHGTYDL